MRTKGFTLLEVMISLAIVGAVLVTAIYTLNYHLGLAERESATMITTLLAQQKLTEMYKVPAETSGSFEEAYRDLAFRTSVSETLFPGMIEISVTVTGRGQTVTLAELILKPR